MNQTSFEKTYQLSEPLILDSIKSHQYLKINLHQYETGNLAVGLVDQNDEEVIITTNLPIFATFNQVIALNPDLFSTFANKQIGETLEQLNIVKADQLDAKSGMATYTAYEISDDIANELAPFM